MTMRYIHHDNAYQGPTSLSLRHSEPPKPAKDEVRIRVHFAGINRPDLLQRDGVYPAPKQASPHLGLEVSGVIDLCGTDVSGLTIGDPVCALTAGGGYADYVTVPADHCLPLPDMSWLEIAAAMPEASCTLWFNLCDRYDFLSGRSLLVHGGTSSLGMIAIQWARCHNIDVYTTVSTTYKANLCIDWGAHPIIYREASFVDAIRAHAPQKGVDTILDIVGAPYLSDNLRILSPYGHLICLGFMGAATGHVALGPLITKHLTIQGSALRPQTTATKAHICRGVLKTLWPLFLDRHLVPHIDSVYPLSAYQDAHQRLLHENRMGKVLLDCTQRLE